MINSCIITGGTGYIGSNVVKHLLAKGWNVHIVADRKFGYANIKDVLSEINVFEYDGNIQKLCAYFNNVKPNVVFHLAAAVITDYCPQQIPTLIQSNIQFGTEILEAMKQSGTHLFVGTGSYWQNYNSNGYNPVDLYAATKEAFEKILRYYTEAENIRAITLRLFDVYGPGDHRPKLWNIINVIANTNQELNLSPGEQMLDMVYITDVCAAYEQSFELLRKRKRFRNEIYGVYTNDRRSLKDIIELYEAIMGKQINVNYGGKPYRRREVMRPTNKLTMLPGWRPLVMLEEGLARVIGGGKIAFTDSSVAIQYKKVAA